MMSLFSKIEPLLSTFSPESSVRAAVESAGRYTLDNLNLIPSMSKQVSKLQIPIPLDMFRWFATNIPFKGPLVPSDITIEGDDQAVRITSTLTFMGAIFHTKLRIKVTDLIIDNDQCRIALYIDEVDLNVQGDANAPIAMLLKSGSLDLSKPGNILNFLPIKIPGVVSAKNNDITVDLFKIPVIATNDVVRKIMSLLTPVINISAIYVEEDMLVFSLRTTPLGVTRIFSSLRMTS